MLTRLQGKNDGKKNWGRGSMIASMIEASFLADNSNSTEIWAIALDDNGAGVAAIQHLTFGGTPTAAGTAPLYIGGPSLNGISGCGVAQIAITANMPAPAAMATAMAAARDQCPAGSSSDGGRRQHRYVAGQYYVPVEGRIGQTISISVPIIIAAITRPRG